MRPVLFQVMFSVALRLHFWCECGQLAIWRRVLIVLFCEWSCNFINGSYQGATAGLSSAITKCYCKELIRECQFSGYAYPDRNEVYRLS